MIMALRHLAWKDFNETKHFASGYLIGADGVLKVFLAVSLFRERLWAFPLSAVRARGICGLSVAPIRPYALDGPGRRLTLLDWVVMALNSGAFAGLLRRAFPHPRATAT